MSRDDLADQIRLDFSHVCAELARARRRQSQKDTPMHRAAVAECQTAVDAVLDLYYVLHPVAGGCGDDRVGQVTDGRPGSPHWSAAG